MNLPRHNHNKGKVRYLPASNTASNGRTMAERNMALRALRQALDKAILATPTSDLRDRLTELNILFHDAVKDHNIDEGTT